MRRKVIALDFIYWHFHMHSDITVNDNTILIVTGSTLRAEQYDRPLAYQMRKEIFKTFTEISALDINPIPPDVIVLSDLWYLNSEQLHDLPTISIGGPKSNGVSAFYYNKLDHKLSVNDTVLIQMDPFLQKLKVAVWGQDPLSTQEAIDLFVKQSYLTDFVSAVSRNYNQI